MLSVQALGPTHFGLKCAFLLLLIEGWSPAGVWFVPKLLRARHSQGTGSLAPYLALLTDSRSFGAKCPGS